MMKAILHVLTLFLLALSASAQDPSDCGSLESGKKPGQGDPLAAARAIGICPTLKDLVGNNRNLVKDPEFLALRSQTDSASVNRLRQLTTNNADRQALLIQANQYVSRGEAAAMVALTALSMQAEENQRKHLSSVGWYKILNAIFGNTLQGIGTGMQLSASTQTQHRGDVIQVVGIATSIFFALCTASADLDPGEAKTLVEFQAQSASPVYQYMQLTRPDIVRSLATIPAAGPNKGAKHSVLSGCAVTAPPEVKKSELSRAAVSKDFNELKATIFDFSQAMSAIVNRIDALENELSLK